MDRKDEIKKELEEISPFMAQLKKENPFEVPANYFEQLPGQLLEQAKLTPVERSAPQVSWLDRLIASFAFMLRPQIAFGLLCLVALTWTGIFMLNNNNQAAVLASEASIPEELLIEDYITNNIDEFDTEILAQVVFEEESQILPEDSDMDEALIDEILDELEGVDIEDLL